MFPRWYSLDSDTKNEGKARREADDARRAQNVVNAREDAMVRKERSEKAYDVVLDVKRLATRQDSLLQEHAINEKVSR